MSARFPISMPGILAVGLVCAGCGRGAAPAPAAAESPAVHGPRRATAQELLDAAKTGVVPDWFSEAEKAAVVKLK